VAERVRLRLETYYYAIRIALAVNLIGRTSVWPEALPLKMVWSGSARLAGMRRVSGM
jgi:hypothetical protein